MGSNMKPYSQETTHLFMSSISGLMSVVTGCSNDGNLKEPQQPPIVNQRFKGIINCIADSLHNTDCMFDLSKDNTHQISSIEYHIDMVTISKNGLDAFEEYNEALNITGFRVALERILEALTAMKNEVLLAEAHY